MICKYCGKEFTEDWRKDTRYTEKVSQPVCCSRSCSSKYSNSFPKAKSTGRKRGTPSERKGRTKKTDATCAKISEALKGKPGTFKGRHHSVETKERLSLIQSRRIDEEGHGGFLNVKYYKISNTASVQYSVRGTWELRVAEWLNSRGCIWERKKYLGYTDLAGVHRTYVPDFYLPDSDEYWEIKGYFSEKDKTKLKLVEEQNKLKIKVLQLQDLKNLGIL